jgi:hypothetical protein
MEPSSPVELLEQRLKADRDSGLFELTKNYGVF